MPPTNPKIAVDSCVFATMHYLRKTAFASAILPVNTNAPGTRFEDNITRMYEDGRIDYCNMTFDVLPNVFLLILFG